MVINPIPCVASIKCYDTDTEYKLADKLHKEQIRSNKIGVIATWSIILNVVLFIGILILL